MANTVLGEPDEFYGKLPWVPTVTSDGEPIGFNDRLQIYVDRRYFGVLPPSKAPKNVPKNWRDAERLFWNVPGIYKNPVIFYDPAVDGHIAIYGKQGRKLLRFQNVDIKYCNMRANSMINGRRGIWIYTSQRQMQAMHSYAHRKALGSCIGVSRRRLAGGFCIAWFVERKFTDYLWLHIQNIQPKTVLRVQFARNY